MTNQKFLSLKGTTAADLIAMDFVPRDYIVFPWLREQETALLWAASGVGKTMLSLSLAILMAGGGRMWEWTNDTPRKVLLIDGEMHKQDLSDRLKFLSSQAVEAVNIGAFGHNLEIICRQDQKPETEFYDITNPIHQVHLLNLCRSKKIDVLIIDNLSTVADGLEDENDATAFRAVQAFMLKMKQAHITTVLVHHSRKDGQEPRGSTALQTTFEVIIGLKKPQIPVQGKASFNVHFTKLRAQGSQATTSRLWTLEATGWVVEDNSEDELVVTLRAIQSNRFETQKALAEYLGLTEGAMSKRLTRLVAEGRITRDGIKHHLGKARLIREAEQSGEPFDLEANDFTTEDY